MAQVHTFTARDGSAAGASSLRDGSNLPGGAEAWDYRATLDEAEMVASSGVVGVGNAAEVLEAVRVHGFYVSRPSADA